MPASTTFFGVSKSGSPISRWTMSLPWRSSARALFKTSKAVSVPRRDMRCASFSSYCVEVSIVVSEQLYPCAPLWRGRLARKRIASVVLCGSSFFADTETGPRQRRDRRRVSLSHMFSRRTDWKLTPNRFTQAQQETRAAGREVLDLTISNPTRAGFDYDRQAILRAFSNAAALDYAPQPKGLLSARHAVAEYYRHRGKVNPESLLLTASTSEGYSFVFRLLANADDEVLVPK